MPSGAAGFGPATRSSAWATSPIPTPGENTADCSSTSPAALAGFDKQYAAAVCDTRPVLILTHSPLQRVPADTVNLHGHIHAAPAPTRHHRNLSVERTGYQPIRLSELLTTDLRPASST